MTKLIAILNVIAWSGFWAFGYMALASGPGTGNSAIAAMLALAGAGVGIWAYITLMRHARDTGYEKRHDRAEIRGAGPVNQEDPT